MLCPASILRDHPDIEADFGEPLGKGLRSLVRIANGVISYHECSVNLPAIKEIQTVIYGGSVERDTEKGLIAYLKTIAPTKSLERLNQRLGISAFEMQSGSMYLSSDPANPTVFRGAQTVTLPAGERLLDINSWREVTLPMNITCRVSTQASGHLQNNRFYGDFISDMDYKTMNQQIRLKGEYEIFIA